MDDQTRQVYIRAAITFLQNSKLVDSPLQDKLKFLKDKGLSDVEVDEALNLALVNRQQPQNGKCNLLLILGLCVGCYKLYTAYQESKEHHLASQKALEIQSKRKELENHEDEQKKSTNFAEILDKVSELRQMIESQRANLNKDIQSIKTLLLGHEKFAAPPSIPAWQLEDAKKESKKESKKDSKKE